MILLATACAPRYANGPPKLPDDAIRFQLSYSKAFDRIVQTLEEGGYDLVVADRENGIIETRPRVLKGDAAPGGPFDYRTFLSIRVGAGWRDAWAVVHLLLVPGYPKEQERVLQQLQEGLSRP